MLKSNKKQVGNKRQKLAIRDRSKLSTYGRRTLSILLCAGMVVPTLSGLSVKAAEKPPVYLESSRLDADSLPEGDVVYFGTAGAAVPEEGDFAIKVYRDGSLKKKATVEVHTVDMMAVYGEDYELLMDDVEETGDGKTFLEKYVKEKAKNGDVTSMEDLASQYGISQDAGEAKTDAIESDTVSTFSPQAQGDSETAANVSSLAAQKEAETGEKTRELTEGNEAEGLLQTLQEELVDDAVNDIDSSSKLKLTFAPGESEKVIRFRILDDDKSEGTEGFSMLLANPAGAQIYKVSSASITIQDDEEVVRSKVSFTKKNYQSKDGKAVLKVKRTGAEYSVCDMAVLTSGDTAKAGVNYTEKNETLSFAPYETEKEIEIDVQGSGKFDVLLTELKGCEEGKLMKASVEISENEGVKTAAGGTSAKAGKSSGKKGSASSTEAKKPAKKQASQHLDITVENKSYTVEYNSGDLVGKIMDYSYGNPLEVGAYYFAADKSGSQKSIWTYGKYARDKTNNRESRYDSGKGCGILKWWGGKSGKGFSYVEATRNIPGIYYKSFYPDWSSGDNNSDKGRAKIQISNNIHPAEDISVSGGEFADIIQGDFGRTQSRSGLKNVSNENISYRVMASDEYSSNAKSSVQFYGLCAMYRKYKVTVGDVGTLGYRVGTEPASETSLNATPMGVKLGSGANLQGKDTVGEVYPSVNDDTRLVFALENSTVNGNIGKFGNLTGFKIQIKAQNESDDVTVNYPEDYTKWLNSRKGARSAVNYDSMNYNYESVQAEIDKVKAQDVNVISFDRYFLKWLASNSKVNGDINGYAQDLRFTPVFEYEDVKVTVMDARGPKDKNGNEIKSSAEFNDPEFKSYRPVFHAGDTLDLSARIVYVGWDDRDEYAYDGYDVYTDNNPRFDTIRSTDKLFLSPGHSYKIRPVIAERENKVEVIFEDGAEEYFEVLGTFTQDEINNDKEAAEDPQYRGKHILKLHPEKSGVKNQANPTLGTPYTIKIVVKDKYANDSQYVYRPRIQDESNRYSDRYVQQSYTFYPGNYSSDNIIKVRVSKVERSKIKKYTIKGTVHSQGYTIPGRTTGMKEKHYPVANVLVSAPTGRQVKSSGANTSTPVPELSSSQTNDNGEYTLREIYGVDGDLMSLDANNGLGMENDRFVISLSSSKKAEDGSYLVENTGCMMNTSWAAPRVTGIDYNYDLSTNNKTADTTNNTVQIYDDTLTVTATLDTKGHTVKEAVFVVYTMQNASGGSGELLAKTEYKVPRNDSSPSVFRCKIPKMTLNLHNGDKLYVKLVDENNNEIETGDGKVKIPIEYPEVDTGLVFAIQNNKVAPQTYDLDKAVEAVNVPVLNSALGSSQSGLLVFGKTEWGNNSDGQTSGYTLQLGVDASYGTAPKKAPTNKQKLQSYQKFHQAVQQAQKSQSTNAEDVILDSYGKTGSRSNLNTEKSEMQDTMDQMKSDPSGSSAKNPLAGLNSQSWKVEVAYMMAFDFVWNKHRGTYEFDCGSVALGGSFTFNKTMYTMIEFIPAFVNFSANLQMDLTAQYVTAEGKTAMTAGDFEEYEGNLAQRLSDPHSLLSLMIGGKLQVGVGMCGILDARGYVGVKLQFDIGLTDSTPGGTLLHTDGGLAFDVIFTSIDFNVADITVGWGTLANQTKFEFFGGMSDSNKKKKAAKLSTAPHDGKVIKKYASGEQLLLHDNTYGSADLSKFGTFGGKKKASLDMVNVTTLFDNTAERTRPQIIPLEGEKKMVVFIGSREDKDNAAALCYSVYDGENWSSAKVIAEDGTMDASPDVLKVGNKVVIAWADANRKFTAEYKDTTDKDKLREKFNSLGISAAVYDIAEDKMGEEISLADDGFCNFAPQISADGSRIFCSYMKRDLSNMETVGDLTNFEKIYSTMAYVTYDMDKGERQPEEKIQIYHKLSDPLVMDFTSTTTEVNNETYLLSTYTVDGDRNLQTDEDKEVFLAIYNVDKDRVYYPIQITSDNVVQSVPKLSNVGGSVYLTWMEGGYNFHIMDVSEVLTKLFDTTDTSDSYTVKEGENDAVDKEVTINKDAYINGYIDGDNKNENWYKRTAKDLGVDEAYFEGSEYDNYAKGIFHSDSANFAQNEDVMTNISSYELVTNGDDIYIFYTDFSPEANATGKEIYGVRYKRYMGEEDNTEEGFKDTKEDVEWGFGKAVQITDNDKVIDEMSLYMTEDNEVYAVSNYFTQEIVDGQMQYSPNKLVEIDFKVANSLEVDADNIELSPVLVGGSASQIEFDVVNQGLLTTKGFDYQVYEVTDGKETEIDHGNVEAVLDSGESWHVFVPWNIPNNVSGTSLKITVTESGVDNSVPRTVTCKVPYESNLEFKDTAIVWEDGEPYVESVLTNEGNASSEAAQGELCMLDDNGEEKKTYGSFDIPALASGESKTVREKIDIAPSDFGDGGRISLGLFAKKGDNKLADGYAKLACMDSIMAELNGGKDFSLKKGENKKLTAVAAPWNDLAGTPVFFSSDQSVAQIDTEGNITGTGDGEAEVSVYYPSVGVSDTVNVKVSGGSIDDNPSEQTKEGTKKITPAKNSVVVAAGKSTTVKYTAAKDSSASKAAAVTASIGSKSVVSKVTVSGSSVKITVAKKAKKGASTTVTLKSKNAAGKTVSAKIKVTVQNKTKKLKAAKSSVTVKKGKTAKITLKVTAENNKKATTDSVKVSSKLVSLSKKSAKKGKVTVTLKGKKKGSQKVTIKVGSKKVKVKVKVK